MLKHTIETQILRMIDGDQNALKLIYDFLCRSVYLLSLSILKEHYLAEDNTQDVFIKLLSYDGEYCKGTNAKAWIMKITRNNAIDLLRKRKNIIYTDFISEEIEQESTNLVDGNSNVEETVCERSNLNDALKSLDGISREIIILYLGTGLKFREISELINVPLDTVTWKYQTALKKLRYLLI